MLTAMLSALGGLLMLVALFIVGSFVEDAVTWFGERIGVGALRLVTAGRYPRAPTSGASRLVASLVGLVLVIAATLWVMYAWRAA